jgi:hypothetical protein
LILDVLIKVGRNPREPIGGEAPVARINVYDKFRHVYPLYGTLEEAID